MRRSTFAKAATGAAAIALLTSGCLGSSGTTTTAATGTAAGAGKATVEVMYGFGNEQETAFQKDLKAFADKSGFTIKFTKAGSWDTEIKTRVAGGNPPDVGLFPQPGVMCDLAKQGKVLAYDDATVTSAKATLVNGFVGAGTCTDGKVYGLPSAVSVKSLLWYDAPVFAAAGYKAPTTLAELDALTEKIKADGKTPWCIAAESGGATGWPITDWIEDLVLRFAGPENYDKWVAGTLKFNSPEIKPAWDYFQKIAFTEGNVRGGTKAIAATNFQTGGNVLFDTPPACHLFKQATFIAGKGGFPDNVLAKARHRPIGVVGLPAQGGWQQPGPDRWRPGDRVQQRRQHAQAAQLHRQQGQRRRGRQGRLLLAAQVLRRHALPEQDAAEDRQRRSLQVERRSFRRVGPHAGQGRRRDLLDRAHQVDLRYSGPRRHAEQHRRELAEGR
jgi:alpha-glucoside transport system substrate-binding protein